ncbi:MAG: hypothetical protein IT232_02620 [Flavobacteriales bacterium]|nr:hypothetical protein [Flavobacteriales bacterium]
MNWTKTYPICLQKTQQSIPTEVAEAKLLFYDFNGQLIIEEHGESKLIEVIL